MQAICQDANHPTGQKVTDADPADLRIERKRPAHSGTTRSALERQSQHAWDGSAVDGAREGPVGRGEVYSF